MSIDYNHLMQQALIEAEKAFELGEVPVGAVMARNGEIIARGHNLTEDSQSVTKHAEIQVLEKASNTLQNWRLSDLTLCVTLEPCPMCAGALRLSRVATIVYGAADPRMGAFGSTIDLSKSTAFGPVPEVIQGIQEERCRTLLQTFFQERRKQVS